MPVEPANGVYRQLRLWHGYLSAFAFLAVIFFAATGIVLNHPGALDALRPPLRHVAMALSPADLRAVRTARDPGLRLVTLVGGRVKLLGLYQEGQVVEDELYVRLQGVRGSTSLRADLRTGAVAVTVDPRHPIAVLNELHRAESARWPWRAFVDAIGGLLIVVSLLGYALFLTMRFRLRTALALTALSLAVMAGLFAVSAR